MQEERVALSLLFSSESSPQQILTILSGFRSSDALKEKFEEVSHQQSTKFWKSISQSLQEIVKKDICGNEDVTSLKSCAVAFSSFLNSKCEPNSACINGLLDLHKMLDILPDEDPTAPVRNSISMICEAAYLKNWPHTIEMIPDILTYLLIEALKPTSKEIIVKRLHAVSKGIDELDLTTAGVSFNRDLLLRCFVHPTFLKSTEGQKLLVSIALASEGFLLNHISKIINSQISNGAKFVSGVYGSIYSRMWKESSDQLRNKIEDILQDLLNTAVHTTNAKYFKGLRYLIKTFHDVKRSEDLENALVKIYEPILWRSLQCANCIVRTQTAMLYFDVFPLQKLHVSTEQSDLYLQKQFDQLANLLKDTDHRVRSTSVIGTCHIIRQYWDILPFATISTLLKFIFDTLSHDVSHANVRLAVLSGLQEILLQPLSHLTMKTLLPIMKNLLHDRSEKVRLAFINLLLQIKDIREISLFDVVSFNDLLDRLVLDSNHSQICLGITELLVPTYYPHNGKDSSNESSVQLQRCIQFIEDNYRASEIFYFRLKNFVSLGSVVKLNVILFQLLNANLSRMAPPEIVENSTRAKKGKRSRNEMASKNALAAVTVSLSDKKLLFGIISTITAMLQSIQEDLIGQIPSLTLLFKYFTPEQVFSTLQGILTVFEFHPKLMSTTFSLLNILIGLWKGSEQNQIDMKNISSAFSFDYFVHCLNVNLPEGEIGKVIIDQEWVKNLVNCVIALRYEEQILTSLAKCLSDCTEDKQISVLFQLMIERICQATTAGTFPPEVFMKIEVLMTKIEELVFNSLGNNAKNTFTHSQECYLTCLFQSLLQYKLFKDCSARLVLEQDSKRKSFQNQENLNALVKKFGILDAENIDTDSNVFFNVYSSIAMGMSDYFHLVQSESMEGDFKTIVKMMNKGQNKSGNNFSKYFREKLSQGNIEHRNSLVEIWSSLN